MSPLDRRPSGRFAYTRKLSRLLLYLDDIDDVVAYLKSQGASVVLLAGSGLAEDGPEDLRSATRKEIRNVDLVAVDPDIEVQLGLLGSRVATTSKKKLAQKTVDDVFKILNTRKRWFIAPVMYWALSLGIIVGTAAYIPYFISVFDDPSKILWEMATSVFQLGMALFVFAWTTWLYATKGCVVVFRQWRRERLALVHQFSGEFFKPAIVPIMGFFILLAKEVIDLWSKVFGS